MTVKVKTIIAKWLLALLLNLIVFILWKNACFYLNIDSLSAIFQYIVLLVFLFAFNLFVIGFFFTLFKKLIQKIKKDKGKKLKNINIALLLLLIFTVGKYNVISVASESYYEVRLFFDQPKAPANKPAGNMYSYKARYRDTHRCHETIVLAEKKYGIQKGLLAGLIMQESMGNPLQLNFQNDGGAGLMMFQPGTARQYGLKTYGSSATTGADHKHGRQLADLVRKNNFDYARLSQLDERFHVQKSIDAGARFLHDLYKRHQSWDKAVSAYNRGSPALLPGATLHVKRVRQFQGYYLSENN